MAEGDKLIEHQVEGTVAGRGFIIAQPANNEIQLHANQGPQPDQVGGGDRKYNDIGSSPSCKSRSEKSLVLVAWATKGSL